MARLSNVPQRLARPRAAAPPAVRRRSARGRGYTSAWDKASRAFLSANPICRGCAAMGRAEPATLTDHVIPHRGDHARFWDERWWQASCDWHHNEVKQALERRYEAGEIGADDLWLDSEAALAEAHSRAAAAGGGSKV